MNHIIIVPYRNRAAHMSQFLSHMQINYPELHICIVEQYQHKPFNRAKLLNIGFLENIEYDYFIFHDVDMLPINANYAAGPHLLLGIVQLAGSSIQAVDYLGGVTRFNKESFMRSGGYNNEYYHRAEDNEMMFNIKRLGLQVISKPQQFKTLPHKRTGPEFDPALWQKAQQKRVAQNQLTPQTCLYSIEHVAIFGNVKHIVAAI